MRRYTFEVTVPSLDTTVQAIEDEIRTYLAINLNIGLKKVYIKFIREE